MNTLCPQLPIITIHSSFPFHYTNKSRTSFIPISSSSLTSSIQNSPKQNQKCQIQSYNFAASVFLLQLSASGSKIKLLSSVNETSKKNPNTNMVVIDMNCNHAVDLVPSWYDAKEMKEKMMIRRNSIFWRVFMMVIFYYSACVVFFIYSMLVL